MHPFMVAFRNRWPEILPTPDRMLQFIVDYISFKLGIGSVLKPNLNRHHDTNELNMKFTSSIGNSKPQLSVPLKPQLSVIILIRILESLSTISCGIRKPRYTPHNLAWKASHILIFLFGHFCKRHFTFYDSLNNYCIWSI
jgi:hypothetical protein